jgi:hypothetical protein
MANIAFEYRIALGEPDESFCRQLAELSNAGWQVAALTHGRDGLICLLKREKDFEVAQSLHVALEETQTHTEAISRHEIPPEEMTPLNASPK